MAKFNSKQTNRRSFSPSQRIAAGISDEQMAKAQRELRHIYSANGDIMNLSSDPSYSMVPRAATATVRHYLFGCEQDAAHNCGWQGIQDINDIDPTIAALAGIRLHPGGRKAPHAGKYPQLGSIHFDGDGCEYRSASGGTLGEGNDTTFSYKPMQRHRFSLLGNQPTLGDYMSLQLKLPQGSKAKVSDIIYSGDTFILGRDAEGRPVRGSRYGVHPETGEPLEGSAMQLVNTAKLAGMIGANRLVKSGRTDIAPYFGVAKICSHLAHGSNPGEIEAVQRQMAAGGAPNMEEFYDLTAGAKPLGTQGVIEGVLRSIGNSRATIDTSAYGSQAEVDNAQRLLKMMPTARIVQSFCPHCIFDRFVYGSNTVHDTQMHYHMATSKAPGASQSYFCAGYPVGYHPSIGRVSDLGLRGKEDPHRIAYGHPETEALLRGLVRNLDERRDVRYQAPLAAILDTEGYDIDALKRKLNLD